jgi:hypothetical protein
MANQKKKIVWINYYPGGTSYQYPSKSLAEMSARSSRIGCIRVELEPRFDKELSPTEPGALVGRTVRLKGDESRHWIVVADKRTQPSLPATRWPIVLCSLDGLINLASEDDVLDLLP